MPRRKSLSTYGDNTPSVTAKSRQRSIVNSLPVETGDPEKDGEIWLSRISMTRQWRMNRKNGENDWRRYYKWYRGDGYWDDRGEPTGSLTSDNARDTATVNKFASIVNSIVPFLINGEIKFLVDPRRPQDNVSARIQGNLLNYHWTEGKFTRQMTACAKDAAIIGWCVSKTGYTVEVDQARNPEKDGNIVYADYIRADTPWIERINPLYFLWDPQAKDHTLHTARWCAEVFFVPLANVLANADYDKEVLENIALGDWTPATRAGWEGMGAEDKMWVRQHRVPLPEDHLACLIEIWDWQFQNRMIYADGIAKPLFHEDWPYEYLDKFPYEVTRYITDPNEPFGIGIGKQCEDQWLQKNRIRTAQFGHIRSHQRKFTADEGLHPDELSKFERGPDGTIIKGLDAIKPIPDAPMSNDFQLVEARIDRDIEECTGADAVLQGRPVGGASARVTGTEIAARARLTGLKLDAIVDNIEAFVQGNAVQTLQHIKANKTLPDVVRIVGQQGIYWDEYTPEDIQSDVDVTVQSFSAPDEDPQVRQQQWLQLFQLGVQALPLLQQVGAGQTIDIVQLLGRTLEEFGEADIGRFFKPALTPQPPLQEGEAAGPGAGLPPALAGQLAPGAVGGAPPAAMNPAEGLSPVDLQQLMGGMINGPIQ